MSFGRILGLALGAVAAVVSAASAAEIASHRASYTLSLGSAKPSSGIVAITGAMYIEWQEVCGGWTINQRMRFEMIDNDGERLDNDISFSSWEARDGLSYRFTLRSSRNGEVTETLRGRAQLDGPGKGGTALFVEPEGLEMELPPGTLFPTEHTLVLIRGAEAGERTIQRLVFDGATQDGALDVNAIIGSAAPLPDGNRAKFPPEIARKGWKVRMAFFKTGGYMPEPDYETSLILQENGVGRDYTFEYSDFAIKSRLDLLEVLPKPRC